MREQRTVQFVATKTDSGVTCRWDSCLYNKIDNVHYA